MRLWVVAVACLFVLSGESTFAQSGSAATELAGVDMSGLTVPQRATALKIMSAHACGCACGIKVAECRVRDPNCSYSKGLGNVVVATLKAGKTEAEAIAAAESSQWAHAAEQDNRILSPAVKIPVDGSPLTGAADARVKLVEFSDFQCPYCVMATPQLEALLKAYPGQISLTFKQFPLDSHSQAAFAAIAALAAQKQTNFGPCTTPFSRNGVSFPPNRFARSRQNSD